MRLATCRLQDPQGGLEDPEPVRAVLVRPPLLEVGDEILCAAEILVHPVDGQRILWIEEIEVVGSRKNLSAASLEEVLRPFVVEPALDALQARAEELSRGLALTVHLADAQSGRMALLAVLVHASPLRVSLPTGRTLTYGPLQGLVIGETGSGKTTAICVMSKQIGLAEIAASDATSRAGLLFRDRGDRVVPGLLPRNHGRMAIVDEFHKIKPDEIRAATYARGQGVLSVNMADSATLPMQTRLMAVGNLRLKGAKGLQGSASIALQDLEHGIMGSGFLEPEDLRRFDFVMVASRREEAGTEPTGQPADMEQIKAMLEIYWAMGLDGCEETVWHEGAYQAACAAAKDLRDRFETSTLPIFGPDTLDKVCRLAAAAARLMPAIPDCKIHITVAHVQWTQRFLSSIYEAPENGLAALVRAQRSSRIEATRYDLDQLYENVVDEVPEISLFIDAFAVSDYTYRTAIASMGSVCLRTIQTRVGILKDVGLLTTHGSDGLRATPLMRRLIQRFGKQESGNSGKSASAQVIVA